MEIINFSITEKGLFKKSLTFINNKEVDFSQLPTSILIVKTDNFIDECEELAPYYSSLGLESNNARLVFNPGKGGGHKILINQQAIRGLSYIHTIVTELVHLSNLAQYSVDHGNIYRFSQDKGIAQYYYEFLLWTKFQAMRVATRAHALISWHEVNGTEPPADGRYQFAQINFPGEGVGAALEQLQQAEDIVAWREGIWGLLEALSFYFGILSFYQQVPKPQELDDRFPTDVIEEMIGLDNCLAFYEALQRAPDYPAWLEQRQAIRKAIYAMQEQGKKRFEPGA
jgi:hypothetical protein